MLTFVLALIWLNTFRSKMMEPELATRTELGGVVPKKLPRTTTPVHPPLHRISTDSDHVAGCKPPSLSVMKLVLSELVLAPSSSKNVASNVSAPGWLQIHTKLLRLAGPEPPGRHESFDALNTAVSGPMQVLQPEW